MAALYNGMLRNPYGILSFLGQATRCMMPASPRPRSFNSTDQGREALYFTLGSNIFVTEEWRWTLLMPSLTDIGQYVPMLTRRGMPIPITPSAALSSGHVLSRDQSPPPWTTFAFIMDTPHHAQSSISSSTSLSNNQSSIQSIQVYLVLAESFQAYTAPTSRRIS